MDAPLVSVVMPTYNRVDILPNVLASILDQDFTAFELLIVDDSTDGTETLIRNIQQSDARVRYLKLPENKGLGNARQAGINMAKGKYIALADSDDLWISGKLRKQIEVMEAHPDIDVVFGDYLNINHVTHREYAGFANCAEGIKKLKIERLDDHFYRVLDGVAVGMTIKDFLAVPTMVYRAEIFQRVGEYRIELRSMVDHEYGFRSAALGAKFAYFDYPLIFRHVYPDSHTADTIRASQWYIKALGFNRQTCESINRPDLRKYVDHAIHQAYIDLMYYYGNAGQRQQVWNTYMNAWKYDSSYKNFPLFLVCLAGPTTITIIKNLKRLFLKSYNKFQHR